MSIDARLLELGIEIPGEVEPAGNYIGCNTSGNLAFTAGQVPIENGERTGIGKLGREYTIEDGYKYARMCGLMVLCRLKNALGGNLDRVVKVVKLTGFVNSTDDFIDQPKVLNGASDLMIEIFGEAGRHSRSAVGVNTLPMGICVEVEGIFEIRD